VVFFFSVWLLKTKQGVENNHLSKQWKRKKPLYFISFFETVVFRLLVLILFYLLPCNTNAITKDHPVSFAHNTKTEGKGKKPTKGEKSCDLEKQIVECARNLYFLCDFCRILNRKKASKRNQQQKKKNQRNGSLRKFMIWQNKKKLLYSQLLAVFCTTNDQQNKIVLGGW